MIKDELQILAQAILNEIEGYEFYKLAASQAKGETAQAFLQLAEEEKVHAGYLQDLSERIAKSEEEKLQLAYELQPPSPEIYKWENLDVKGATLAMTVFGIAVQLEQDAIRFYEDALEKSEIPEAQEVYCILIQWEKVHLDQFTKQYNIYKNEWWSEQNFAPF